MVAYERRGVEKAVNDAVVTVSDEIRFEDACIDQIPFEIVRAPDKVNAGS